MRVVYEDDKGRGVVIVGPADVPPVGGGTVTITGKIPEQSRTAWSLHLGNFVTRGGSVVSRGR